MKKKLILELDLVSFDKIYEKHQDSFGETYQSCHKVVVEPDMEEINKTIPRFFINLNREGGCAMNGVLIHIDSAKFLED